MRRGYGFLVLSLVGLCGAVGVPAKQDDPKAETVFRNITALKGSKASDIIPSMQFMSAALKVDCDYCHTGDRSSDEKRAKQTTREMIAMQNDINTKNFGGRTQVTCATCHAGHEHPIAFPPIQGLEVRARRSQTLKADDILASYAKAVGTDAAKAIPAIHLKGTSGVDKTPVEITYSGTKFAVTIKDKKGDIRQGFNGSTPWLTYEKAIRKIPMQYATAFINQNELYLGPDSLPKIGSTSAGTATLAGKENNVVTGSLPDKTRVSLFFDKTTSLLSRVSFYYPTILGSIAQINDYSDYKKVNGVFVPMTIANHSSQGEDVFHFRSANVDPKLDMTVFDPPAK
jgi:hypothetical protein